MEEYECHVKDIKTSNETGTTVYFCGKQVIRGWAFESVDHAVATGQSGSRLGVCKDCRAIIINFLNN